MFSTIVSPLILCQSKFDAGLAASIPPGVTMTISDSFDGTRMPRESGRTGSPPTLMRPDDISRSASLREHRSSSDILFERRTNRTSDDGDDDGDGDGDGDDDDDDDLGRRSPMPVPKKEGITVGRRWGGGDRHERGWGAQHRQRPPGQRHGRHRGVAVFPFFLFEPTGVC